MHLNRNINSRRIDGFTLIEIMIVLAIIAIVIAIAGPTWLHHRRQSRMRICQENLAKIDGAKQQWALEGNHPPTDVATWGDLCSLSGDRYIKANGTTGPRCPTGSFYEIGTLAEDPSCQSNDDGHELQIGVQITN